MPAHLDRSRSRHGYPPDIEIHHLPCAEPRVCLHLARLPVRLDGSEAQRLDTDERARHDSLVRPVDRVRFLGRRLLLRAILAHSFGLPSDGLCFARQDHGKPVLRRHPDLHFNASHAGDWLLVATSRHAPVGVDIERVMPELDWRTLLNEVCCPAEARACLTSSDPRTAFFRLWTAKEAVLKARGTGLAVDPRFALLDGARWAAVAAPPGYLAALALSLDG